MSGRDAPLRMAQLVLLASGFAGLGYELLWTRLLATALGHEIHAVLAVVAAFFCGSALGAFVFDRAVRGAARPARWYAVAELVIGAWAVVLTVIVPHANRLVPALTGATAGAPRQWCVAFGVAFVLLAPATVAIGLTLPAAERIVAGRDAAGPLYAANTLGAVAGLALTTHVLVPVLGHAATSWGLAALNVCCAVAALKLLRTAGAPAPPAAACDRAGARAPASLVRESASGRARGERASARPAAPATRLLATVFATGLLGIGYEVLVTRVLGQVLENTVYSFASVLAVFLAGSALGAWLAPRAAGADEAAAHVARLLFLTAAGCLLGTLLLPHAGAVYRALAARLGGGQAGAIGAEVAVAALVLLPATLAMGASFALLAVLAARGPGLGRMVGANTLGGALAPVVFGVLLLPLAGSRAALLAVGGAYAALAPAWSRPAWRWAAAPLARAAAVVVAPGTGRMVTLAAGERVLDHREGVMAAVTVVEDAAGQRHLKVNDRFQMGGTASLFSDAREAHLPLLLHPAPRRALFLGLGAGVTFAAARVHPGLEAIGVELVPEIVDVLPHFAAATGDLARAPQLSLVVADARRYVLAAPDTFDVVVGDLFHPARDGAGALYTVEHFAAVRRRLAPGGLYCQWLPLYQMDLGVLRTIARSFLAVFPDARLHVAHYSLEAPIVGLVGWNGTAPSYDADWFERRVPRDARLRASLEEVRVHDTWELLGGALAGPVELARFAGAAPLNTDDRPVVTYAAPRFAYAGREPAASRLVALVDAFGEAGAALARADDERARLAAYVRARNGFIRSGRAVPRTRDLRELVRAARGPLLDAVRTSPDFLPAYQPLLSMAARLHELDPAEARRLLVEIDAAQPARAEARALLAALGEASPPALASGAR